LDSQSDSLWVILKDQTTDSMTVVLMDSVYPLLVLLLAPLSWVPWSVSLSVHSSDIQSVHQTMDYLSDSLWECPKDMPMDSMLVAPKDSVYPLLVLLLAPLWSVPSSGL
jgi:hypothetical protein